MEPTNLPTGSGKALSRRDRLLVLVILSLLLLLGLAVVLFLLGRDRPPNDLWAEASYVADPDCEAGSAECPVFIDPLPVGHGGSAASSAPTLYAVTYPGLDDPIAQWGQCMDSVLSCLTPLEGAPAEERAAGLHTCVAASACPQACRDRYAARAGTDLATAHASFVEIFVEEDAWCAPRQ